MKRILIIIAVPFIMVALAQILEVYSPGNVLSSSINTELNIILDSPSVGDYFKTKLASLRG